VSLNRKPGAHIVGLEDVRVYHNGDGALCCTATSWEYSDKIRIFQSLYDPVQGIYSQCRVLDSPLNQECEKNWIPVERTNDVIYSWNPLRVGTLDGTQLKFHTEHKTPWMFSHFRGSAVAFRPPQYPGETWALVHMVEYCTPRKYFHLFVRLGPDYKPKSISLPFVFRAKTIEYCGKSGVDSRVEVTPRLVHHLRLHQDCLDIVRRDGHRQLDRLVERVSLGSLLICNP
jgi:hypothetical protein